MKKYSYRIEYDDGKAEEGIIEAVNFREAVIFVHERSLPFGKIARLEPAPEKQETTPP